MNIWNRIEIVVLVLLVLIIITLISISIFTIIRANKINLREGFDQMKDSISEKVIISYYDNNMIKNKMQSNIYMSGEMGEFCFFRRSDFINLNKDESDENAPYVAGHAIIKELNNESMKKDKQIVLTLKKPTDDKGNAIEKLYLRNHNGFRLQAIHPKPPASVNKEINDIVLVFGTKKDNDACELIIENDNDYYRIKLTQKENKSLNLPKIDNKYIKVCCNKEDNNCNGYNYCKSNTNKYYRLCITDNKDDASVFKIDKYVEEVETVHEVNIEQSIGQTTNQSAQSAQSAQSSGAVEGFGEVQPVNPIGYLLQQINAPNGSLSSGYGFSDF